MHEAETRQLKRAVLLLLCVSVVRWGWASGERPTPGPGGDVLPALLAESREAADEAARRAARLGDGEKVDPNRADEVQLDRLPGVGATTARAIVAAREEGLVFDRPEDLLAVRGIGPATLDRIRGDLDLADAPLPSARSAGRRLVDVNTADLHELQSLPGIGPAIAERILVARREQSFVSVDDLARVRGIGSATVERLRALVTVGRGR